MNILLADDSDDDVFLFQEALKSIGAVANIVRVRDGQTMLGICNSAEGSGFDLIITDYYLPKLSGQEVIENFSDAGARPPIVVFSSHLAPEQKNQLLTIGATRVVDKPVDFEELCILASEFVKIVRPSVKSNEPA